MHPCAPLPTAAAAAVRSHPPIRRRRQVIENESGNRTTPSIVAFTDEERLVGEAARNQAAQNPHNTVFDAKRLIGMRFSGEGRGGRAGGPCTAARAAGRLPRDDQVG